MQRVGLQTACYIKAAAYRTISRYRDMKCHDISISLLGYDMITSVILKTSIISPRSLLYLRVGSFRHESLSMYDMFLRLIISLVALFCTFSISVMSLF